MNDLSKYRSLRSIFSDKPQDDDVETVDDFDFFRGFVNGMLLSLVLWVALWMVIGWWLN